MTSFKTTSAECNAINWTEPQEEKLREQIEKFLKNNLINSQDDAEYSLLMHAASNGQDKAALFLIQKGADVNLKTTNGRNALFVACGRGYTSTAEILLDNGADVNAVNQLGSSPLMWAADNGHTQTIKMLIDRGADVNLKNKSGFTALMWAADRGYIETVQTLIDAGADIGMRDKYGKSAWDMSGKEMKLFLDGILKKQKGRNSVPTRSDIRAKIRKCKDESKIMNNLLIHTTPERHELAVNLNILRHRYGYKARARAATSEVIKRLRENLRWN